MRSRARAFSSAVFLSLGIFSFASLPWVHRLQTESFQKNEPFFSYPIPVLSNRLLIRNDRFGKGIFGASRNGGRSHQGLDLLVREGSPIFAAKSGRVRYAGEGKGYGQYVEIVHADARLTRYAHLSKIAVSKGDWVKNGQEIGLAGKSGNASHPKILPHLHFEIREGNRPVNPQAGLLNPKLPVR